MLVVEHMKCILETMHPYFCQQRIFNLFKSHEFKAPCPTLFI